jgi:hypothetical protein
MTYNQQGNAMTTYCNKNKDKGAAKDFMYSVYQHYFYDVDGSGYTNKKL